MYICIRTSLQDVNRSFSHLWPISFRKVSEDFFSSFLSTLPLRSTGAKVRKFLYFSSTTFDDVDTRVYRSGHILHVMHFSAQKKITEKLSRMRYLFHSFLSTLPLYGYSFIILLFYSLFLSTLQLCSCSCKSSNIFVFPIENVPPFRNAYCMLLRVFLV